ncbi:glycosyltransferase family 4 protein [Alkalicoccobacillus plakortidis]|uniref:Glycosyltransferase family 4 protein n=1 Tax=Alkalicoccobacillus plakortidis TaxID=444060 RepID=A0ABT0XF84_9BACI|nr:glycosyltransferase family 4 protein [Alkalicoccobacillus plakortidis]MCM2674555.1 glycosyltransferase family 4 protein [Alkalicoccobacillus plakortidis]
MKIALFTDTYHPQINGVATSIMILEKYLVKRGHEVYIFTSSDSHADLLQESGKVYRFRSLGAVFVPERRLAIAGLLRASHLMEELGIELIHTHTEFSMGLMGKLLAKKYHLPCIHTYHTMYKDYLHYIAKGKLIPPSMVGTFSRLFCKRTFAVIAPTEKVKNQLENYNVNEQIRTIPTGIDFAAFKRRFDQTERIQQIKKQLGLLASDRVLLSVGRIAAEKNMQALILAMPDLLKQHPKTKLVMVGDGPAKKELVQLTKQNGLSAHVLFVGAVKWCDIPLYYHMADLFVSASTSETQGLTYIEAMASGLPVVAKNDPSIQDLVIHHKTGFLFQKDEDLSHRLIQTLLHPESLPVIKQQAKRHINNLSAEHFADQIERLYEEAIHVYSTDHHTLRSLNKKERLS